MQCNNKAGTRYESSLGGIALVAKALCLSSVIGGIVNLLLTQPRKKWTGKIRALKETSSCINLFCLGFKIVSITTDTLCFQEDILQCGSFLLNLFVNLCGFGLI